jgi:hypothetical protein
MNNATPPDAVYEGYPGILTRRKREVMSCERPSFLFGSGWAVRVHIHCSDSLFG